MRTFDGLLATLTPILLLAPGCASTCCEPERLPHLGRAETPEALFELIKHSGRYGCDDQLYELMSPKTREKIARWKFTTFWDSDEAIVYPPQPVPDGAPFVYTLAEVVRGLEGVRDDCEAEVASVSSVDPMRSGAMFRSDDEETPRHLKISYERPHAPGQQRCPNVNFHLLVVQEKAADGRLEWRLGLLEQLQDGVGGNPKGESREFPPPKGTR